MKKTLAILLYTIIFSTSVFAVDYTYLAPIPNQSNIAEDKIVIDDNTLEKYFKNLYRLGIVIATGLAVLMIMWGGIEYITTDAMGGKEEAKERISSAIMGLLLALGSFVILRTIDPNLVSVKLDITGVDLSQVQSNVGTFDFPEIHDITPIPNSANSVYAGVPDYNYYPGSETLAGLAEYRNQGAVAVTDNIGNPGTIDPAIAWMRDNVPGRFDWAVPSSTFRSAERNNQVGGSSSSAHLRGQAIDFFSKNSAGTKTCQRTGQVQNKLPVAEGDALVTWAIQNSAALGIKQIIFNNMNSREDNGWQRVDGGVNGLCHYDHVHIGR